MKLSVLQWNIWYKEDPEKIVGLLKELAPDIICLQELTINFKGQVIKDVPAFIANELGYDYYVKPLPIESTDGESMMLANGIFSKYPVKSQQFSWINQPKHGGGYSDEYRAYVEVCLEVEREDVFVATSHMSYVHAFQPTPAKHAEADLLVKELSRHDSSFIFCGDLNATPNSYTVNQIESVMQSAGPSHDEKTWTTKPFSYNGFEEVNMNWRLDYIFSTPDLTPTSSRIIQTEYSDHLPILVEFELDQLQ